MAPSPKKKQKIKEDLTMGLRIQNNISAMNAHRNLSLSDAKMAKSLNRLSSGFRINVAADDAAGLAVSQSFRADIASFRVATRNTSEATALLQVAEGASDQIGNMLTRLKELATQASSANAADNLSAINNEASAVLSEIDRIANSTTYGDSTLIQGTYGITVNATGAGITAGNGFNSLTGMKAGYTYKLNVDDTAGSDRNIQITSFDTNGTTMGVETAFAYSLPSAGSTSTVTFSSLGLSLKVNNNLSTNISGQSAAGDITAGTNGQSTFQVGAINNTNNQLTISIDGMQTTDLNINSISMGTASASQAALNSIDAAIDLLNASRAEIGAYVNRLSYAGANLATTVENVQAAESVIRDVDMASEMSDFTKNQILLQAGTAMLAQANMAPQQVLALFG